MKSKLIGFTGAMYAGKTTAAQAVVEMLHAERMSFADPIRFMLYQASLTADDLGKNKHLPIPHMGGKTGRQLMQTLGTEWGRQMVDTDIWLNLASLRASRVLDYGHAVVFDDVRFDNEAQMIRDKGGIVIAIFTDTVAPTEPCLKHASERGVSEALLTDIIYNDRSNEFPRSVCKLVAGLLSQ